jgi:hypothetical protein
MVEKRQLLQQMILGKVTTYRRLKLDSYLSPYKKSKFNMDQKNIIYDMKHRNYNRKK